MSETLTWREALQAMLAGEEVEQCNAAGVWQRTRMLSNGAIEVRIGDCFEWDPDSTRELALRQWRRVAKVPRVHELPAKWRNSGAPLVASELEAALRNDELVSLKGVTAVEVEHAWYANERVANAFHFALNYLRERAKKGGE
jgi:hypothetical protein